MVLKVLLRKIKIEEKFKIKQMFIQILLNDQRNNFIYKYQIHKEDKVIISYLIVLRN